jgi:serine/threonine protein kinase
LGEDSAEALAYRWLLDQCAALGELNRVGLVHGDVSPKNLIVQGGTIVLTDYDTASPAGDAARGGTLPYTSPAVQARQAIQPADDLYALAASLFHCLTDREPFAYGTERRKDRGLNWYGIDGYATLRPFLDRATHPDPAQRFADALDGRRFFADAPRDTSEPDSLRCVAPERILSATAIKNSPRGASKAITALFGADKRRHKAGFTPWVVDMQTTDIEGISVAERRRTADAIWASLLKNESEVESPEWHQDVLTERRGRMDGASAEFVSLAELKAARR